MIDEDVDVVDLYKRVENVEKQLLEIASILRTVVKNMDKTISALEKIYDRIHH